LKKCLEYVLYIYHICTVEGGFKDVNTVHRTCYGTIRIPSLLRSAGIPRSLSVFHGHNTVLDAMN